MNNHKIERSDVPKDMLWFLRDQSILINLTLELDYHHGRLTSKEIAELEGIDTWVWYETVAGLYLTIKDMVAFERGSNLYDGSYDTTYAYRLERLEAELNDHPDKREWLLDRISTLVRVVVLDRGYDMVKLWGEIFLPELEATK